MKYFLTISIIAIFSASVFAQNEKQEIQTRSSIRHFKTYRGVYPREALDAGITGTINLTYDVDSNCNFINVSADTTLDYGCDEYALDFLKHIEKETKRENYRKCTPSYKESIPVEFRIE